MTGTVPLPTTVGVVPLEGRGALPFVDLHRDPLFLHAVRALLAVDVLGGRVVVTADPGQRARAASALERGRLDAAVQDADTWWRSRTDPDPTPTGLTATGPLTVLLHDPLCPLVPTWFLGGCLEEWSDVRRDGASALVAYRPVTDTIKTVVDGRIVDTLDRDLFGAVASPVIFEHAADDGRPDSPEDFAALVRWLRDQGPVRLRKAPSLGRRVDDPSAVNLLECMDEMAHAVREI